jgi:zinc/manganese transport system permease protein
MGDAIGPLELMLLPFAECLVLVGIHSYLGLHVLQRQVIFVDLALAQIAALGTTIAFLFSIDPLSKGAYVFSLIATVIGAAVFSLTRFRDNKIPQEAIIGLVYAIAAALGILIVAQAPHGAEHIQKILTGSLLWVKSDEVAAAAAVYGLVGAFHFVFRRKFSAISRDPEAARAAGVNVRLWDFLFYVSFGLVITHSVRTAGVLLVFVFLVAPAIMALLVTRRVGVQLAIGWVVGTLVSVGGLTLSYAADSATGPTVVSLYGGVLLATAIGVWIFRSGPRWRRSVAQLLVGVAVVGFVGLGMYELGGVLGADPEWAGADGPSLTHHHHHHADAGPSGEGAAACEGDCPIDRLIAELAPLDIESKTARAAALEDAVLVEELLEHVDPGDEELTLVVGRRLLQLDTLRGAPHLIALMTRGTSPLMRDEALGALREVTGEDFGFDPWDAPTTAANREALEQWRAWSARRAASTR